MNRSEIKVGDRLIPAPSRASLKYHDWSEDDLVEVLDVGRLVEVKDPITGRCYSFEPRSLCTLETAQAARAAFREKQEQLLAEVDERMEASKRRGQRLRDALGEEFSLANRDAVIDALLDRLDAAPAE